MSWSPRVLVALLCLWIGLAPGLPVSAEAPGSQKRIALVIGNAAYEAGALATPANDAGLVAQTLQAAGFDVVGARDLDEDSLRKALRDFADKAAASGPDTVAFVYLAGYGLQLAGENYFVPVDAKIAAAADVPVRTLRLSDYTRQLAALPLAARFVVLDGARNAPFAKTGDPLAGGLALAEAEPGSLIAFNASPGTVGPDERGPYGAYATALVEMIREGGLTPAQLFDRMRLRVDETTKGAEVPWHASRIEARFAFFERAADAPPIGRPEEVAALRARSLREIGAQDAYAVCLQRDTIDGYQEFVQAYPRDAMAKRVRALIAARREAVTWRRTWTADSRDAYWSYLDRYPRGPHAWDARRRLRQLSAALEPPPRFSAISYDVPPPPPEEIVYVERPALYLDDPVYAFAPPPPPPPVFLPPPPAYIVDLAPPPPPVAYYALPTPAFVPVPTYVSAPAYVAPPPDNVIYQNIHNVTVINTLNERNAAYARAPEAAPAVSPGLAVGAGAVAGAALGAAAARVALPPAVAQKAASRGPNPAVGTVPGGPVPGQANPQQAGRLGIVAPGQPLPGSQVRPLPQQPGQPAAGAPGQPNPALSGGPASQQAGRPGSGAPAAPGPIVPPTVNRPGQPLPGADGQLLPPQQAARPDKGLSAGASGKPGPAANLPADSKDGTAPLPAGRGRADMPVAGRPQPGQPAQTQADRPGFASPNGPPGKPAPAVATPPAGLAPDEDPPRPQQAGRSGPGPSVATGGRPQPGQPLTGQLLPDQPAPQRAGRPGNGPDAAPPRPDALAAQRQQADQARQAAAQRQQQQAQAAAQRQQMMQQQQAQQAAQRQQMQAQQGQAAAQRQQQQAAQRQQMMQQQQAQAAAQRQQMMQQQQAQAAAQRQQQMQAQVAAQRQQMMQQQQAQAAAQRQQMMMQRQQAPRPAPHGGGHGCPPGMPCR